MLLKPLFSWLFNSWTEDSNKVSIFFPQNSTLNYFSSGFGRNISSLYNFCWWNNFLLSDCVFEIYVLIKVLFFHMKKIYKNNVVMTKVLSFFSLIWKGLVQITIVSCLCYQLQWDRLQIQDRSISPYSMIKRIMSLRQFGRVRFVFRVLGKLCLKFGVTVLWVL